MVKLIFYKQINIKKTYKLISTIWTPKFSTRSYYIVYEHDETFSKYAK